MDGNFMGRNDGRVRCQGILHIVKQGDTLYKIAKRYGVPLTRVMYANPYVDVYNLQVGDEICVPVLTPRPPVIVVRPGDNRPGDMRPPMQGNRPGENRPGDMRPPMQGNRPGDNRPDDMRPPMQGNRPGDNRPDDMRPPTPQERPMGMP